MRRRNDTLRKGCVFAVRSLNPVQGWNRSLFFAEPEGQHAECMQTIRKACAGLAPSTRHHATHWLEIDDITQLCKLAPDLDPSRTIRIEAQEFSGLSQEKVNAVLRAALERFVGDESDLFPRAGGAVGGIARGVQFLDREGDIANICRLVSQGKCVRIVAPRRVGKSSVLCRLEEKLKSEQDMPYPVLLDLERSSDFASTAARLLIQLEDLSSQDALCRAKEKSPAQVMRDAADKFRKRTSRSLILLLDEPVYFFNRLGRTEDEIRRDVRESLKGFSACTAQHVLASSVDFYQFIENLAMGSEPLPEPFANAVRYALSCLPEDKNETELRRVLIGTGLVAEAGDIEWIRDNLDLAVPYPTLHFLDELAYELRTGTSATPVVLAKKLTRFLFDTRDFADFERHLDWFQQKAPQLAKVLEQGLATLATIPWGQGIDTRQLEASFRATEEENWQRAFRDFRDTFPVAEENGQMRFVSRVFRQWWRLQKRIK